MLYFCGMKKNTIKHFLVAYFILCIGGLSIAYSQDKPLPVILGFDTTQCSSLIKWTYQVASPSDTLFDRKIYDSSKICIENCAAINEEVRWGFSCMHGATQFLYPYDGSAYDRFRDWCISVLYLNTTDPYYFCHCLGIIADTYPYDIQTEYSRFPLASQAVYNYLRSLPNCDSPGIEDQFISDSAYMAQNGYGSNLPPLDSIGLGFLLTHQGVASPSQFIVSFMPSPNPFEKETTLKFTLYRTTYINLAVYDELGILVWGNGKGSSLEGGEHEVHLNAASFPSGALYARISTGFGEIKTVKLIHN
jgi:hypothetical protein